MVDIDNDIRKKHDLRTTDGKAAAKKEQVKRNKEQAKREKERAKEQAERDAYIKWAKKNNHDPDATPTEDVLKEFEKNRPRGGRHLILFILVLVGIKGVLDIVAADFVSQVDKGGFLIGIIILSLFLTKVIYQTLGMWSRFKLKLFIIFILIFGAIDVLEEDKKGVTEQTPSADITSSDLTENNGTSVKSEDETQVEGGSNEVGTIKKDMKISEEDFLAMKSFMTNLKNGQIDEVIGKIYYPLAFWGSGKKLGQLDNPDQFRQHYHLVFPEHIVKKLYTAFEQDGEYFKKNGKMMFGAGDAWFWLASESQDQEGGKLHSLNTFDESLVTQIFSKN